MAHAGNTTRDVEILELYKSGETFDAIAKILSIPRTFVNSRTRAMRLAGLILGKRPQGRRKGTPHKNSEYKFKERVHRELAQLQRVEFLRGHTAAVWTQYGDYTP